MAYTAKEYLERPLPSSEEPKRYLVDGQLLTLEEIEDRYYDELSDLIEQAIPGLPGAGFTRSSTKAMS